MNVTLRLGIHAGEPILYMLWDDPDEVHAIPGWDDDGFVTDRPHEQSATCSCGPRVVWNSAAAPRPLYEHTSAPRARPS